MHSVTMILGVVAVLCMPLPATAQQETPELQALDDALPGTLINDPSRLDWKIYGAGQKYKNIKGAEIPGGGAAVQIKATIKTGDMILVAILARNAPGGTAHGTSKIGVRINQNAPPFPGFGENVFTAGSGWKLLQLKSQATTDIAGGKGVLVLHLGTPAQSVEIGQVYVINTSSIAPLTTNP